MVGLVAVPYLNEGGSKGFIEESVDIIQRGGKQGCYWRG